MTVYSTTMQKDQSGRYQNHFHNSSNHSHNKHNYKFSAVYEIDRVGTKKEISDNFIIDEDIAELRARAEFLEYGYDKQEVTFTTFFNDLAINDIIKVYAPSYRVPAELNKDRFIIKRIKQNYKDGALKTIIKAVRYD